MAIPIIRKKIEPEEGEYEAELIGVRLEEANIAPGDTASYVRFTFKLLEGESMGKTVDASVPNNFMPGSKLDGILKGFGVDASQTEELDAEGLKGHRVRIFVEHRQSKRGTVFPSVTRTKPSRKNVTAVRPATPVQPKVENDQVPF